MCCVTVDFMMWMVEENKPVESGECHRRCFHGCVCVMCDGDDVVFARESFL